MLPNLLTEVPGPRSRELSATLRKYECRNTTFVANDWPIFWQRAAGVNVWDADGNRFLDLTSAFGVAGLGHGNPHVRAALVEQSAELIHAMGDVHPAQIKGELCRELSRVTFERWNCGDGKTILGNSGFEAVEAALKTALIFTGKAGVISFTGAYHGLGYGALEVGGISFFREPFRRQLREFATMLPFPVATLGLIREQIQQTLATGDIGCILVEPIQGRGGTVVPPRDFLPMLREICDQHKILLIADEIFTGFNRTGTLFACEHSQVTPDLICLGKALTSGFPLSACVGRAEVMDAWPESRGEALHTSTFLGNPLGCAMALASIREHVRPETAAAVVKTGVILKNALRKIASPRIREVRGMGLMMGLELINLDGSPDGKSAIQIVKRALGDGLILLADSPVGNVLSFTPPFEISDEEIAFACDRIQEYLTSLPGSIS